MKKLIISGILLNTMSLSGCIIEEDFRPVPDIEHYTIIQNNSNHQIKIINYRDRSMSHTLNLDTGEYWDYYNEIFEEDLPFFPAASDSARVVYDNSVSVLHTKEQNQQVENSLLLLSSFTGGKVNDKLYEIYYTFTDADYEEAVELNEGG